MDSNDLCTLGTHNHVFVPEIITGHWCVKYHLNHAVNKDSLKLVFNFFKK